MREREIEGIIIKGIGGFYYVDSGEEIYECRGRGKFRKEGITPLVGDRVVCLADTEALTGTVYEIRDRESELIRPAVANVTQMAAVFSPENPKPNLSVVDKMITSAIYAGIKPIICINKTDISDGGEYEDIYERSGFETIMLSAKENINVDRLKNCLKDEITVFAGNSGVGKSSLLNAVFGEERFETGDVSGRVERGRHTTRHSELLKAPSGGYIIDTPGFSSFTISELDEKELMYLFPEFKSYMDDCMFSDCTHRKEKGCGVLRAVEEGLIPRSRHESYLLQYQEILDNKKY